MQMHRREDAVSLSCWIDVGLTGASWMYIDIFISIYICYMYKLESPNTPFMR